MRSPSLPATLSCANVLSRFQSLDHWKKFFADSEKYQRVGRVAHAPIDPGTPLPPPCKQGGGDPREKKPQQKQQQQQRPYGPRRKEEL